MAQATKSRAQGARSKTTKRKATKATKVRKPSSTQSHPNGSGASSKNGSGASSNGVSHGVAEAAKKAKTPLIAGGAAVAGAASGLALGARRMRRSKPLRRPLVKVDSHDVARVAKSVGRLGIEMGELASELRRSRELSNGARRRSPIEVVLQGLTHRSKAP